MDQSAFRSLLSAPRDPSSSTSTSTSTSKKALGGASAKRGWGLKPKDTKAYEKPKEADEGSSKPSFAPRATHKKILAEGGYKDRAALRRKGVDDEYKSVEKLLEDFERTAKESGADEEEIRKQRAYLGGDAEHSILVKGLDYALLAARKAELAQENEEVADEELDALARDLKPKKARAAGKEEEARNQTPKEKLGKGFRSIGQKEAELAEKKIKKKKKKVKAEVKASEETIQVMGEISSHHSPTENVAGPSTSAPRPTQPPVKVEEEEEEDIFADAGEYDLNVGLPSDEDEEEEEGAVKTSDNSRTQREDSRNRYDSRSRSRSKSRDRRGGHRTDDGRYSRWRDGSEDSPDDRRRAASYSRSRSRSRSRDRYASRRNDRDSRDERYVEEHADRRSYGHPMDNRYRRDEYGRREEVRRSDRYDRRDTRYDGDGRLYDRRHRSPSPYHSEYKRRRYDSPSPARRQYERSPDRDGRSTDRDSRDRYTSRSPSPSRHRSPGPRRIPSRSPSSPPRPTRPRSRTRSITPPLFAGAPPPLSRSPSPTDSDRPSGIPTKLAPLQGSAISDVKSFLSYDAEASAAEDKRLKKAQWRARQGLGVQEGIDPEALSKKRDVSEKMRANNDYVKIMKRVEKGKGGDDAGE